MTDKLAKAEQMKQSLKVADTGDLRLETMADMETYCRAMVASKLLPYTNWTELFVVMQTARDLGVPATQAIGHVFVVNKKPQLDGQLCLALIRASSCCEFFNIEIGGEGDEHFAQCRFKRHGSKTSPPVQFTVAEAKKAGLWGRRGPWTTHSDDMLMWKAVSRASKFYFSDVTLGLDIVEVARDYTESRSPAPERQPPSTPDPLLAEVVADDTFSVPAVGVDEELPPLDDDDAPDPFEPPPGALSTDPDDLLENHGMKPDKDTDKGLFE